MNTIRTILSMIMDDAVDERLIPASRGVITIDPDIGALHESASRLRLGPTKTPASARTIQLPPFLVALLREHLADTQGSLVFTSIRGGPLWRSTFDRRVLRPAVDGDPRRGTVPIRPGLTFHGLRHSHKTWLIADRIPEIAQAKRLGHHLSNRLQEVYSHVAPEVEAQLLRGLERRWKQAHATRRPKDNRPSRAARQHDPNTAPVLSKSSLRSRAPQKALVNRPTAADQPPAPWEHTAPTLLPPGTSRDRRQPLADRHEKDP